MNLMSKDSRLKLVCFDFDQTIFDSGVGFAASYKVMAKEFQKILDSQGVNLEYKRILEVFLAKDKEFNRIKFYNRDLWWNRILKDLYPKFELIDDEIKRLTDKYWNTVIENSKPYPDTIEILEYLKDKYILGLITDTDGLKGMKHLRIEKSNIAHYFERILVPGEDTPEVKPSPEPFFKIAEMAKVKISKEQCVMVGDKPFTDIKGAIDAGFTTILILRANWEIEPTPDYSIKELKELKNIL